MSDPENFLSRWARRKRDVAEADKPPNPSARPRDPPTLDSSYGGFESAEAHSAKAESGDPGPHNAESNALDSRLRGNERISDSDRDNDAPFDLASLPSVESITADTDIRGFFAPGVPEELTRAALRRAWAADPKIRDFVGLEENAWDFNNPESIPGFGKLEMTDELRREVQRIVGNLAPEPRSEPEEVRPASEPGMQPSGAAQDLAIASVPPEGPPSDAGQSIALASEQTPEPMQHSSELRGPSDSDAAVQNEHRRPENLQVAAKRGHGGAMPK